MDKEPNKQIELLQTEYAKEQFAKFEKERRQVVFRRRRLVAVFCCSASDFCNRRYSKCSMIKCVCKITRV